SVVDPGFQVLFYPSSDVPDSLSIQVLTYRPGLAPTRAPRHPSTPRATTFRMNHPPSGNDTADGGSGAMRYVVARGGVERWMGPCGCQMCRTTACWALQMLQIKQCLFLSCTLSLSS